MNFKDVDRIPVVDLEGFIEETIRLWSCQGYPASMRVEDYFGFEIRGMYHGSIDIDFGPIPSFVERTLKSDSEYITRVNRFGYTEKRSKHLPMRSYGYTEFPIGGREDWEEMKGRYGPQDIRRYPKCWGRDLFEYCRESSKPVGLGLVWGPGRGPKGGYGMGVKRFLSTFARDPDMVHDMFSTYADFVIEVTRPVLDEVDLDYVLIDEDGIAYRNGPLVSPGLYREFYLPHVKRVLEFFRDRGVGILGECSSGDIGPLIPLFLEAGYNLLCPLESACGMDAVKLREEYGRRLLLMGNISRQSLMGGKKQVEREFEYKVPSLVESGGYIPAVDDIVMPDASFESYRRYIELVKSNRMA
jgi:uroporphyrinogen decarboxylase